MDDGVCHRRLRVMASLQRERSEGWVVGVRLACEGGGGR